MPSKIGFDVSHHNNPKLFNFPLARAQGLGFMIARVSYGKDTADRQLVEWAKRIRGAGFSFGVYLFYRQIHTVEDQLALFDRQLDLIGGLQPGDMYPALDMEDNHVNNDGFPKAQHFSDSCRRIASIWKEQFGNVILYYSSFFPEYLKEHKGWIKEGEGKNYLHWLADYSVPEGKPRTLYSPHWNLHQSKPRPSVLYPAPAKVADIDHDVSNPAIDFDALLIKPSDLTHDHVSDDAVDGEDGTTDRPGGALPEDDEAERAAREAGFKKLAEGLIDLQDGIEALRRTR